MIPDSKNIATYEKDQLQGHSDPLVRTESISRRTRKAFMPVQHPIVEIQTASNV